MRLFFFFSFFCVSTLHAQWIMNVGNIFHFYSDPVLLKKNKVSSFYPIEYTHDHSAPPKDRLKPKWRLKECYWTNEDGFVIGGGIKYAHDTISFHHFQKIPGDSIQWMMTWDSIKTENGKFYLFRDDSIAESQSSHYLTIDSQGRFVFYRYYWRYQKNRIMDSRYYYHYTHNRLDSITCTGGWNYSVSYFLYDDQNQLEKVMGYHKSQFSDSLRLQSTATYHYYKNGLLKKVKETFTFSAKYWYLTRFKWKKKNS